MINNNIETLLDIAWTYINQQNVNKALSACQHLVEQCPKNDDAWFANSFLHFQLGDGKRALFAIEKAVKINPNNQQWLLHHAHCLVLVNNAAQANNILTPLISAQKQNTKNNTTTKLTADLNAELALILNKLLRHHDAEFFYQQAIEQYTKKSADHNKISPQHLASLYFNLASMQRYLGKIIAAVKNLTTALELDPTDCEAFLLRASLTTQTSDKNHIPQGKQLLKAIETGKFKPTAIAKAQLYYGLAKECEDIQDYQQSFYYLSQGANIRRKNMHYKIAQDVATIEQIIKTFNADFFKQKVTNNKKCYQENSQENNQENNQENSQDKQTIFILGLPRTGSTLVERILSSHSDVFSAGELNDFAIAIMTKIQELSAIAPTSRLAVIALSKQLDFSKLGQAYNKKIQHYGEKHQYVIDKLPLNSLYIGLIYLALPNAKIIHVKRDPMDTCYAIYKQLFTQGYPFSYDLDELAQYVIAHHKLMAHWHNVLPNVVYDIKYETLIKKPIEESKKLLNFCQLNWQDACEHFHQNSSSTTTASASQVRQPIYKTSLEKWRNYEQQLAPLQQQLKQAGLL